MPKFKVIRRVDAWIDYVAVIEAQSPELASQAAHRNPQAFSWSSAGCEEFPNTWFATLDEHGNELPDTVSMSG